MRRRILVVDDTEALRDMLAETMARGGFEVLAASTVAEALELAAGHEFDAVLTDLEMPGSSGLELCQALRRLNDSLGRTVPVWVMTGSHEIGVAGQVLAAGACGLLRKPFNVPDVCARLQRMLQPRLDRATMAI